MNQVEDAPGMLRVRLREDQTVSGSGNNYPTALVVAEHAERAAFARQALAVKLRELDGVCAERDRLDAIASRISQECRDLAVHCTTRDADLDMAIRGNLRRAR
jgi:hypothetical protein